MRRRLGEIAVVSCILIAACESGTNGYSADQTAARTAVPAVAADALYGWLLSSEQVNAIMGATGMNAVRDHAEMTNSTVTVEPPECLAVESVALRQVYADSGYTGVRELVLSDGDGVDVRHHADQAVVLFPSAEQATAFVDASAQQWPTCRKYTVTQTDTQERWTVGPVSNRRGVLSTTTTPEIDHFPGWGCSAALAARNNTVIDVLTCSTDSADTAVDIVHQIAEKMARD